MSANIDKMSIVIKNYFSAECDVNTTIRQAYERGFRRGASKCDVLNTRISKLSDEYGKLNEENAKLRDMCSELYRKYWDVEGDLFIDPDMDELEEKLRKLGIETWEAWE